MKEKIPKRKHKPKKKTIKKKSQQKKKKIIRKEPKSNSDSKNIPKNYGKAIIKFVHEERDYIERLLININSAFGYEEISNYLVSKKKSMSKIVDLRSLWID